MRRSHHVLCGPGPERALALSSLFEAMATLSDGLTPEIVSDWVDRDFVEDTTSSDGRAASTGASKARQEISSVAARVGARRCSAHVVFDPSIAMNLYKVLLTDDTGATRGLLHGIDRRV